MARFRLLAPMFIEPNLFPAGSVIDYFGPPNLSMEPLDAEASEALAIYVRENPHALVNPTDGLPGTVGEEARASASLISEAPKTLANPLAPTTAAPGKALPGLSDGGKIPPVVAPASALDGIVGSKGASIGADNPAMGDPTKPGEAGAENFDVKREADLKAAEATKPASPVEGLTVTPTKTS